PFHSRSSSPQRQRGSQERHSRERIDAGVEAKKQAAACLPDKGAQLALAWGHEPAVVLPTNLPDEAQALGASVEEAVTIDHANAALVGFEHFPEAPQEPGAFERDQQRRVRLLVDFPGRPCQPGETHAPAADEAEELTAFRVNDVASPKSPGLIAAGGIGAA